MNNINQLSRVEQGLTSHSTHNRSFRGPTSISKSAIIRTATFEKCPRSWTATVCISWMYWYRYAKSRDTNQKAEFCIGTQCETLCHLLCETRGCHWTHSSIYDIYFLTILMTELYFYRSIFSAPHWGIFSNFGTVYKCLDLFTFNTGT